MFIHIDCKSDIQTFTHSFLLGRSYKDYKSVTSCNKAEVVNWDFAIARMEKKFEVEKQYVN